MRFLRLFGPATIVVLIATLLACTPEGTIDPTILDLEGQVTVNMHDQAGPGIAEAHVSFSALDLRDVSTGEWVSVSMSRIQTHDLLLLVNGNVAQLASDIIPAGLYDAMRITVVAVRLVLDDGTEPSVPAPAAPIAVTSMPLILVVDGGSLTITLDFPVDTSFQVGSADIEFLPQIVAETVTGN